MSCRRIKEAGSKTAKTAVTESSVLNFLKAVKIDAVFRKDLLSGIEHTCAVKVIIDCTSHKELRRKIISTSAAAMTFLGFSPYRHNTAHCGTGHCIMELTGSCLVYSCTVICHKIIADLCSEKFFFHFFHSFIKFIFANMNTKTITDTF